LLILVMSQSSQSILDHIAEMLQFISNTQSFWFTLDTSYNHGCHLANRFRLERKDYEVVSPLVALPWCRLVVPAGCCIASCHPLIAPPSCRLVAPAGCRIASCRPLIALPSSRHVAPAGCRIVSRRPLIAPPSRQLVAPACCRSRIASPRPLVAPRAAVLSSRRAGWLLRRPLDVLSSRRAPSRCLITPAHHLLLSSRCTALLSSHCAGWLLRCLSLCRPLVLSS
jgi:hypothetical protein